MTEVVPGSGWCRRWTSCPTPRLRRHHDRGLVGLGGARARVDIVAHRRARRDRPRTRAVRHGVVAGPTWPPTSAVDRTRALAAPRINMALGEDGEVPGDGVAVVPPLLPQHHMDAAQHVGGAAVGPGHRVARASSSASTSAGTAPCGPCDAPDGGTSSSDGRASRSKRPGGTSSCGSLGQPRRWYARSRPGPGPRSSGRWPSPGAGGSGGRTTPRRPARRGARRVGVGRPPRCRRPAARSPTTPPAARRAPRSATAPGRGAAGPARPPRSRSRRPR